MTFVLISSSGTMALAVNYGYRRDRRLTFILLIVWVVLFTILVSDTLGLAICAPGTSL